MNHEDKPTTRTYTAAHWGFYETHRAADGQVNILPYDEDPDPSPIGLFMDAPEVRRVRVRRPAIRKGWLDWRTGKSATDTRQRGEEPFVEVSWDTALDLAAQALDEVRRQHGNGAIFGGSYGWASAGRFHHAQSQVHRFLNSVGGYVRHTDSYSLGAARALMPYIVQPMDELMAEHTDWHTLQEHCQLFVSFGGVPRKNAQIAVGGTAQHHVRSGLHRLADHGVRFVNISPIRNDIVTGGLVDWWPIRPNTDTALILGLAHTLITEDLHDRAFLERYCVGADRFEHYVLGQEDGKAKDAEWASAITGMDAQRIRELARQMAGSRCMINMAWSLQRSHHGEQPYWALIALASLLGQIGLPGGGFGVCYGAENLMGSPYRRLRGPTLPQGTNPIDDFIPVARITDMLLHRGGPYTYQGENRRYPDIKLIYWAGGNPFHHQQDLNRLLGAWRTPETILVNEQYWTPTAKLADIVFPATTTLERNDIFFAQREHIVAPMKSVKPPEGEARNDYDIFRGLAARLGVEDVFSEGRDEMQWLAHLYAQWQIKAQAMDVTLPPFNTFWHSAPTRIPQDGTPVIMLARFRADPKQAPLPTASGKIEIFCERIAQYQAADCPGHPVWIEPQEWLGAPAAQRFPLHLITDQPAKRLHSQLDHSPHSTRAKIQGREPVWIHPLDAQARGISDGDIVRVHNDRGHCLAGAVVTEDIRPSVLKLSTGAWFDPERWDDSNRLCKHGNPNVLTLDIPASAFSQGCSAQTCLVDIERFDGIPPPLNAHELPALTPGDAASTQVSQEANH